jgi:membrane protein YdbS with pleckstrin-like domain
MSEEPVENVVERIEPDPAPAVDDLTGPPRTLDPRIRHVWVLRSTVGALVLGGLGLLAGLFFRDAFWPAPVAFSIAFVVGVAFAFARYRRWSYRVREDSLYLDRGVVTETRTVVPYVRIQHVDVSRGPLERTLGLARLVVYTAGSRGADVAIPGLTPDHAGDLRRRLKQLTIAAEAEDAV